MNDWHIQSRAHACQGCARSFSEKQPYYTALYDLKHEIQRIDLCESCWESGQGDSARDRKGFLSQWHGVYEAPPASPPDAIQKENAESLLRKIVESNNPRYAAASYILAVMLERKRLLKIKEQYRREGQRVFIYEQPRTGDVFTIPDPDLQLNQLEMVQRDVAELLEHGLPGSAAKADPAMPVVTPEAVPSEAPDTEHAAP